MSTVLAVRLRAVKELNTGRIAFQFVGEEIHVVVDVPFVKGESELRVNFNESLLASSENGNRVPSIFVSRKSLVERVAWNVVFGVAALRHFIAEVIEENRLKQEMD